MNEIPSPEEESSKQKWAFGFASQASEQHPNENQDFYFALPETSSAGVFDGVGGNKNGQEAAWAAGNYCEEEMFALPDSFASTAEARIKFVDILHSANEITQKMGQEGNATAALCKVILSEEDNRRYLIAASVGDSRVYVFRDDELFSITLDDSDVRQFGDEASARMMQTLLAEIHNPYDYDEVMSKARELQQRKLFSQVDIPNFFKAVQQLFKERNIIYQTLGREDLEIKPHTYAFPLEENDIYLLTSDGVTDNLTDSEIAALLRKYQDPNVAAQQILAQARKRANQGKTSRSLRPKKDDITVVVMQEKKQRQQTNPATDVTYDNLSLQKTPEEIRQAEIRISQVKNFDQFYTVIRSFGFIPGSQRKYFPEEIIERCEELRSKAKNRQPILESDFATVTRFAGIREKLMELIEKESKNSATGNSVQNFFRGIFTGQSP
jgi:serine/threonine protein phosphatase PrpC